MLYPLRQVGGSHVDDSRIYGIKPFTDRLIYSAAATLVVVLFLLTVVVVALAVLIAAIVGG